MSDDPVPSANAGFWQAAATLVDVDGDGRPDLLLVGDRYGVAPTIVGIFSWADSHLLHEFDSSGYVVAPTGDTNSYSMPYILSGFPGAPYDRSSSQAVGLTIIFWSPVLTLQQR